MSNTIEGDAITSCKIYLDKAKMGNNNKCLVGVEIFGKHSNNKCVEDSNSNAKKVVIIIAINSQIQHLKTKNKTGIVLM